MQVVAIADEANGVEEYDETNNQRVVTLAACPDVDRDGYAIRVGFCVLRANEEEGDCDDGNSHCTTDCTDNDGDSYCVTGDCDDEDPHTFPVAPETNDGVDNQCVGDPGYGVVDEISGASGFPNSNDKTLFGWDAQNGATAYEVVRSTFAGFWSGCTLFPTTQPYVVDTQSPPPGSSFYYLVRATAPYVGSWGQYGDGLPRAVNCVVAANIRPADVQGRGTAVVFDSP